MLSRGDAVVYKCRGLYKVEDIGTLDFSFADRKKNYYTLQSMDDAKDRAYVPTDDESNIRKPVSRQEAMDLISRMPEIDVLRVKMKSSESRNTNSVLPTIARRTG